MPQAAMHMRHSDGTIATRGIPIYQQNGRSPIQTRLDHPSTAAQTLPPPRRVTFLHIQSQYGVDRGAGTHQKVVGVARDLVDHLFEADFGV
jgi:hypothetical protein